MKTLYDVLGVSRAASAAQIEQGYKFSVEQLGSDTIAQDDGLIRGKAIREAYGVLSSRDRRQEYDLKLDAKEKVTYQVVEKAPTPWGMVVLLVALLIGSFSFYKYQAHRSDMERLALEAEKSKADAELAAKLAEAEQARLDQRTLYMQRQAQLDEQRRSEQARREGQQVHEQLVRADAQAARDKAMAEQQAAFNRAREEQAARIRSQNEIAAMQRALNIPIARH